MGIGNYMTSLDGSQLIKDCTVTFQTTFRDLTAGAQTGRPPSTNHEQRLLEFYESVGGADKYVSHNTCLYCLVGEPLHSLPCGHILCTECVSSYGSPANIGSTAKVDICTLHPKTKKPPPPLSPHAPSLRDLIPSHFVQSHFDSVPRDFMPADIIDELVTPVAVQRELLMGIVTSEEKNVIEYIITKARRLFAITIGVGFTREELLWAMESFMDCNINDIDSLPILNDNFETRIRKSVLTEIDPEGVVWTSSRRFYFYNRQWSFLAPVFSTRGAHYDLHTKSILPFLDRDTERREGPFGYVFKVVIHPRYLEDDLNIVRNPKFHRDNKVIR